MTYRGTLRKRRSRTLNSTSNNSRTDAESRTPLCRLKDKELLIQSRNIATSSNSEKKDRKLIEKIKELINREAVEVHQGVSDICVEAAKSNLDKLMSTDKELHTHRGYVIPCYKKGNKFILLFSLTVQ